jgi:hypothetical protein
MLQLKHVIVLALVALAIAYWWRALAAREVALAAARRRCDQLRLQMLDDTVALRGLWLKRNRRGQRCMWRSYAFEFTVTGGERYAGRVVMLADRVERVDLPAHVLRPEDDQDRILH